MYFYYFYYVYFLQKKNEIFLLLMIYMTLFTIRPIFKNCKVLRNYDQVFQHALLNSLFSAAMLVGRNYFTVHIESTISFFVTG